MRVDDKEYDVVVMKLDEVDCRVILGDAAIEQGINNFFKYEAPGAKFRRNKKWDGQIRLYKKANSTLPIGLVSYLFRYCKLNSLTVYIDPKLMVKNAVDKEELINFIQDHIDPRDENKEPIIPYDYQINAIHEALVYERRTLLSATSSGKSLIIYSLVRILALTPKMDGKWTLILVPTKSLVEQLYSDFNEYSQNGKDWKVAENVQRMNGDYATIVNKQCVIATWQTIVEMGKHFFNDLGAVICDETHLAKAESFQKILRNCEDTHFKVGMTGTLTDIECDQLLIAAMLGPISKIVSTWELQRDKRATPLNIRMLALKYSPDECKEIMSPIKDENDKVDSRAMFIREMNYIFAHEKRNNFIYKLIDKCQGNTLILAERVESHLEVLYEEFIRRNPDRPNVFIICGSGKYAANSEEKERVRRLLNTLDNAVVFATFGTTSTGINIKSLANLLVVSSTKSKIRILQSVGRIIRLFLGKGIANVYDIVDDFSTGKKPNVTKRQAGQRFAFYKDEKFPVSLTKITL